MAGENYEALKATFEVKTKGVDSLGYLAEGLRDVADASKAANPQIKETTEQFHLLVNACDGLDRAARSVRVMGDALQSFRKTSVSKSIGTHLDAISRATQKLGNARTVAAMANAVRRLNGVKVSSTVGKQLNEIAAGSRSMRGVDAASLTSAATALRGFDGVKVSTTIGRGVEALGKALQAFPVGGAASDVMAASNAVRSLQDVRVSKSIGTNLEGLAKGLDYISKAIIPTKKLNDLAAALDVFAKVPKSSINGTVNALVKLPKAMEGLKAVDMGELAAKCDELSDALGELPAKLEKCADGFRSLKTASSGAFDGATKKSGSFLDKLKSMITFGGKVFMFAEGLKQTWNVLNNFVGAANDYVEDMNLFNVSLGQFAEEAKGYADTVSGIMGINTQEWLKAQGTFATLTQGMGISSDKAAVMSQQLTQLAYDLSSFYNMPIEEAFSKLQSGMAGETRAVRDLGYDISDAAMQEAALALGISKKTQEMTQGEKAMLRYHMMLNNVTWAQGDMSRTLESPANMLRILQAEFKKASTAIGMAFLPALQAIVPWAVAIMRVIGQLARALASITGGLGIANKQYSGSAAAAAGGNARSGGGAVYYSAKSAVSAPAASPMMASFTASPLMAAPLSMARSASTASDGLFSTKENSSGVMKLKKDLEGVAESAKKATYRVRELRDETISFDELHIIDPFEEVADSDKSGSGGADDGGLEDAFGAFDIPIDTYDFIGDAEDIYAALVDKIQSFVGRVGDVLKPLVGTFQKVFDAIVEQARGLPIGEALESAVVNAIGLVSSAVQSVVEFVAPLLLAFNIPATFTVALEFVSQLCNTLATAFVYLSAAAGEFADYGLAPLAKWLGETIRDAFFGAIELLRGFREWLIQNGDAINKLASYAGAAAGVVIGFATACASFLFETAGKLIGAVLKVVGDLISALVNSAAAQTAAALLGAALATWAVGGAVAAGISGITGVIHLLAEGIKTDTAAAQAATEAGAGGIRGAWANLKEECGNLSGKIGEVMGRVKDTTPYQLAKTATDGMKDGFGRLRDAYNGVDKSADRYNDKIEKLSGKTKAAEDEFRKAEKALDDAREAVDNLGEDTKLTTRAQANMKAETARLKANLAAQKTQLLANRTEMTKLAAAGQTNTDRYKQLAAENRNLVGASIGTTAQLGLQTVAEGALTVASNVLTAAMNAIPGMALAAALGAVMTAIQPLIDGALNAALEFLGLKDASDEATDSSDAFSAEQEQMLEALKQEQEELDKLVGDTKSYCDTHDSMKDALYNAGVSAEQFAQDLRDAGLDMDGFNDKVNSCIDEVINGFEKLETDSGTSLQAMNDAMAHNLEVTKTFSADLEFLMSETGYDSTNAFIQEFQSNPAKYANALHEFALDPTSETSQEFLRLMEEGTKQGTEKALSEVSSHGDEAKATGSAVMGLMIEGADEAGSGMDLAKPVKEGIDEVAQYRENAKESMYNVSSGFNEGIDQATIETVKKAEQLCQQVVDALNGGDGYNRALDAGRNLAGGYGDGIAEAGGEAVIKAGALMDQIVQGLNGGVGYGQAKDAGRNLVGGYGDGIAEAALEMVTKASGVKDIAVEALGTGNLSANTKGTELSTAFAEGINGGIAATGTSASNIVNAATTTLGNASLSASSAGSSFGSMFATGLSNAATTITNACKGLVNTAVSALRDASGASKSGRSIGDNFAQGISNTANNANAKARTVCNSAVNGLGYDKTGPTNAGRNLVGSFTSGLNNSKGTAYSSGRDVSDRAVDGLNSYSREATNAGSDFANNFSSGLSNKSTSIYNQGQSLAYSARNGLASVGAYYTGQDLGSGYVNGIGSYNWTAYYAGYNLAASAVNGIRAGQRSSSPSKESAKLGGDFTDGYALGIANNTSTVVKSASELAMSAITAANDEMDKGGMSVALTAPDMSTTSKHQVSLQIDREAMAAAVRDGVAQAMSNTRESEIVLEIDGVRTGSAVLRSMKLAGMNVSVR